MAQAISQKNHIPWHEVDQMQFAPGWERVPEEHVSLQILEILNQESWLIDGFGPWETIVERFKLADTIVLIDFPLWVHYWWAMERQINAHDGKDRLGGPEGCDLRDVNKEMCQAIWRVHTEIRPKIIDLLEQYGEKSVLLSTPEEYQNYLTQFKT